MGGFVNREGAEHAAETVTFSFGENWRKYVRSVGEEQIADATAALRSSFAAAPLDGRTFIDVGCGSGLFSLAAARLGAARIVSVDVDPSSIAAAHELRDRADHVDWTIRLGSVLDDEVVASLEPAERVYSWGVLHHTGAMERAIENTLRLVAPGGYACLALYNRPNHLAFHLGVKRAYNRAPQLAKPVVLGAFVGAHLTWMTLAHRTNPVRYVRTYGRGARGMRFMRDMEDWVGGLPFEFAEPAEIEAVAAAAGYECVRVRLDPPGGNNEYLLRRPD